MTTVVALPGDGIGAEVTRPERQSSRALRGILAQTDLVGAAPVTPKTRRLRSLESRLVLDEEVQQRLRNGRGGIA